LFGGTSQQESKVKKRLTNTLRGVEYAFSSESERFEEAGFEVSHFEKETRK
jgi:hypothetical protein